MLDYKKVRRSDWESILPTVYGWGVVDVNYKVQFKEEISKTNGRRHQKYIGSCPYYLKWKSVISRCFSQKYHSKQPTYKGCTVCEEWRYLSNFIKWVDSQPNKDWINCQLDKDFLCNGNKHYSPETVVFISANINTFVINCGKSRGDFLLGVSFYPERSKPYKAQCSNPFDKSVRGYVGFFLTEIEAHKAWQTKKHEYACMLADLQSDERVASRLRELYAPDKDWTNK